jgi:hypothetical protein
MGAGYASDVKNIELAARMIGRVCTSGSKIIVEKSTVPVKTAETLQRERLPVVGIRRVRAARVVPRAGALRRSEIRAFVCI